MYRFMCWEIFYGNSTILPKLFFILQLRQWAALESQGVFGYLQMLTFGPETSKLLMKSFSRVFFSKQEEPKDGQSQVEQENGFPLIQKLTFCLSELLLRDWSVMFCQNYCFCFFFFTWCLEIIRTSSVKSYFLSMFYLLSGFGSCIDVEVETSWKRFQSFF